MCGIAGYVWSSEQEGLGAALRKMAAAILHRGPDDEGFFETSADHGRSRVGLAHRRLSIIDLSTGHQPLGNEDGSIQIVFNGEVYNFQDLRSTLEARGHRFATHSDTETIVHAYEEWGDSCVSHFRGMFAFAIWDANRQRLYLARDRYGKKPLFLHRHRGGVAFGSEIKAILEFPEVRASIDQGALQDYFAYRYVPGPSTLFAGISKLMPGSYAVWEKGRFDEVRYFLPDDRKVAPANQAHGDVVGQFLAKLDEAVRVRMISDVPFGAFLSGGLDSSAVVGLMSRHSTSPVKTFSVGFAEARYSEVDHARVVAQQFGTDHHELTVSEASLMQHLPALVRFRDAPVAEPSDIPIYLLSVEARKTVKMVLTGEGADEFLGGYPKHVIEPHVGLYGRLPAFIRYGIVDAVARRLPYRHYKARTAITNMGLDSFEERMVRWFGALTSEERRELVLLPGEGRPLSGPQFESDPRASPLRRILYFDQTSWLPDNLLERGDRMTMAASLEARMPFMDHELAALVSSLPDSYRVKGRKTKWILREAMRRVLPASILERKKVGFRVPVNEWFQGPMREYLYDHLTGADSRTRAYYDRRVLDRVLAEHAGGRINHEKLLWTLLSLEVWHRSCGVGA